MVAADVSPPLGIAYLAAVSREAGHKVKIIESVGESPGTTHPYKKDFDIRGLNFEEITERIPKETNAIGISNLFTFAFPVVIDLAKHIKSKFGVPIIVGGAHPSATPKETLDFNEIDYVIIGEGEKTLIELLDYIEGGRKIEDIDGIAWKENGNVKINPKTNLIQNLDSIPFPARDLLPMENYFREREAHGPVENKWTPIISSRGCPFECTFCTPRLWLRRWRNRSVENVIEEIEHCIEKFGIREFHFEDENLTISKERTLKLCDEIKRRGLDISWQTPNGIRASVTDIEMLERMKQSGCRHIIVAPESGSERVLNQIIKKRQNLDDVTNIVKYANKIGLKCGAYFVIGLPGETSEDIEETISYSCKLAKYGLDEVAFSTFIPLPGSELYDKLKAEGLLNYNYTDLATMGDITKAISWTKSISNEQLRRYRITAYVKFHLTRAMYHPFSVVHSIKNIVSGKQETKTERVIESFIKRLLHKNRGRENGK